MEHDTRSELVTAASELLDRGGPAAVTLREVGRRAGVSHNAAYKHFSDKEELLAAVASRELSRQAGLIRAAAGGSRSARRALRALMKGYVRWARAYPARFKLAFGSWTRSNDELDAAAAQARAQLVKIVELGQVRRELPSGDPERLAALLHSLAHGAVDLALAGHLSSDGKGHADPEGLVDDLLRYLRSARRDPRQPARRHA
jgi:AcrR family transcriptional regulator